MSQQTAYSSEANLAREMGLDEQTVERRLRLTGFGPDDLPRLGRVRDLIGRHADDLAAAFFAFLTPFEEAGELMRRREVLAEARRLKIEHLGAMVGGNYGLDYAQQRLRLGALYSRVHLPNVLFLGAFNHLLSQIGSSISKGAKTPEDGLEDFAALRKVAFFDIGIITDVIVLERERTIRRQQEAIRELSTPVLQLRDRLLMLPIIGTIDTERARLLTEGLLQAIRSNRAKVVVMDVTGVAAVDTKVANHILQTVAAAKLMGATVIVTGLSAEVAQTLVNLGVDLSRLRTIGDLQGGIEEAERLIGYRVSLDGPGRQAAPVAV
jgi:rsbT co-antagonist protein RsbR